MKTTIKLPVNTQASILVDIGKIIDEKTPVAEIKEEEEEKILHLSQLLHIPSEKIVKYLKKNVGETIRRNEIIAEKKGWLSNIVITSPIDGKIKEVNLKKGALILGIKKGIKNQKIFSPVSGKVVGMGKGYLELEVNGLTIHGSRGEGEDVYGSLVYLAGENISVLDVHTNVEEKIVVAHSFNEDALVKLDVMGAVGLVSEKAIKESHLPYLQIDEEAHLAIKEHSNKNALLRPEEKEIVIFD